MPRDLLIRLRGLVMVHEGRDVSEQELLGMSLGELLQKLALHSFVLDLTQTPTLAATEAPSAPAPAVERYDAATPAWARVADPTPMAWPPSFLSGLADEPHDEVPAHRIRAINDQSFTCQSTLKQ